MRLPFIPPAVEERIDEESQGLSEFSSAALSYMYSYGSAWEGWLRHHRGNLLFLAEYEHDLVEAMGLSTRLKSVETNIRRTGRRNERIRSRLLEREMDR
ncbi:MAG: hypothetical protein ABIG03_05535 [Candidatus Eisenbacteria bacterium]